MSSSATKPSTKASKSPSRHQSSLSSHLAMLDLKSRILSSLSKLSDRDTYQIAVDDLESIIASLPADGFSMFLSSLLHDPVPSPGDASGARSSPIVARRESIRLLALLCAAYPDSAAAHLPKIITLIVRRLKDPASDTSLRDACGDAVGSLAAIYLRSNAEESGGGRAATAPVAGLFLKPLLEVMGEQSKTAQAGAAMCLGKVVEGGGGGAVAFQRLCPRICKMIGTQSFLAKGSLLSVLSKLAQIGAISSQSMPVVLQSVRECLENNDWATRKAAADTLSVLASQASHLIADGASQTIASLEACRFDKVKPVRDSIMAALQLWKKILEKGGNGTPERLKAVVSGDAELKLDSKDLSLNSERPESVKDSSADSSSTSSVPPSHGKCTTIPENTADLLKIKAPSLKDKELNPEFFQKLESRNSDDVPVEVVVPRKRPQSSHSKDGVEKGSADGDPSGASGHDVVGGCELNENLEHPYHRYNATERKLGAHGRQQISDFFARDKWAEQFRFRDSKLRAFDAANRVEFDPGGSSAGYSSISRTDGLFESSFMNNKVNWLGIQRQLSHLERQQAYLMNILQDFMGGSHDSFQTLEDRVHGLERIVDEMARDLLESSGRRGGNMIMGFKGSPGRSLASTVDFKTTTSKFGRGGESRIPYPERYLSADAMASVSRGREYQRPDSEEYNSYAHTAPRNGILSCRRGLVASSALRNEHGGDQVSGRRAWDKGEGPFRLGEGPSARSVWQASKDEATLEAIRVAGEDNETFRGAATRRRPIPEVDFETMADGNAGQEGDPVWASWTRAINSIHIGDADSAYAEVLSTGEDVLLVKLMERSGPVINELSSEVANEILQAVGQLLLEQSLFDITFAWIQQLMNLVMENGADFLSIPVEVQREILLNLHQVSTMELQEDSYGASANQILVQLASAWGINIQHLVK